MVKYIYTFSIHLSAQHKWSKNVRQLVASVLLCRTEIVATAEEFTDVRNQAFEEGFELMEIERVPYFAPERIK